MANTPATQFYFDGKEPYAGAQTAETITLANGQTVLRYHAYPLKQGSTQVIVFEFPGITVANYTYAAQFRRAHGSANPVQATATLAVTGAEQVTMTLTAAGLAEGTFDRGSGVWDLEATISGVVDRWLEGTYDVTPEVTL